MRIVCTFVDLYLLTSRVFYHDLKVIHAVDGKHGMISADGAVDLEIIELYFQLYVVKMRTIF